MQAALLAGVGLQRLSLNDLCTHLGLPYPQLLALFNKVSNSYYRRTCIICVLSLICKTGEICRRHCMAAKC